LTPKISMFGAKAGFVIPKNKLAGSLVVRSTSAKNETPVASREDSSRHVQRKTKWAPDLALDPVVCKGRALAYQVSYYLLSLSSFTSMGLCFYPTLSLGIHCYMHHYHLLHFD
jgi:splicing factor 1